MTENLVERALRNLRRAWREIAGAESGVRPLELSPNLPDGELPILREQFAACLEARGGEVSARARAAELGRAYLGLDAVGRRRFLGSLAEDFGTDRDTVDKAARRALEAADPTERGAAEAELKAALTAPRLTLLTQFNALPEGVKFLVDLRAELLAHKRETSSLDGLEADLKHLLATWFDVGFLELKRITWESPAALLEKLIAYEAVHAIAGWQDLKNRLDSDRRCFAFVHPRMPDEPLIFVEVALVVGLAGNIQALLDEKAPLSDPRRADTAIFYSISNAQKGLAGISFGNFLIKRVVAELSREFPNLAAFATLSPIPGFRGWLEACLANGEPGLLRPGERKALRAAADGLGAKGSLRNLLESEGWTKDEAAQEALKAPLLRLAARYLAREKRPDGAALDPVAHFHLSNGARIERLNWMGDASGRGLRQSAGLMVNYRYELGKIEANHEAYSGRGEARTGSAFRAILRD